MKTLISIIIFLTTNIAQQVPCPIVVDVRSTSDFTTEHATCAITVPSATVDDWLTTNSNNYPTNTPFYIYCYAGVLAGKAKDKFIASSFINSKNGGGYAAKKVELEEICTLRTSCLAGKTNTAESASPSSSTSTSSTSPSSSTTIDQSKLPDDSDKSLASLSIASSTTVSIVTIILTTLAILR